MSADVWESHDRVTGPYCRTCGSDSVGCSDCHEAELATLRTTLAQVTAERDAAREAFDNLSTLQQADRKALLDTRGQLATLRADLAALVMQVSKVTPGETRYESAKRIIRQHEDVCSQGGPAQATTLLRGPHAD